jgi:hypothetical protein
LTARILAPNPYDADQLFGFSYRSSRGGDRGCGALCRYKPLFSPLSVVVADSARLARDSARRRCESVTCSANSAWAISILSFSAHTSARTMRRRSSVERPDLRGRASGEPAIPRWCVAEGAHTIRRTLRPSGIAPDHPGSTRAAVGHYGLSGHPRDDACLAAETSE